MDWNTIISRKRTGVNRDSADIRTGFQRDYDRLIFSSAFRRLQNKTQVFPLPGSVFVHNRLTHSLEVASVGRSLGKVVGQRLTDKGLIIGNDNQDFYKYELQNVIAAACLAHDIGNPAFGHSGEKAISSYFDENHDYKIEGKKLSTLFATEEWKDLITFEGNANSFRTLTHTFNGKSEGGYLLSYITLASILKYPCVSIAVKNSKEKKENEEKNICTKKYNFFEADKELACAILDELNITKQCGSPLIYNRHPFVYLTEAADDICYRIIDFEDAQRLSIISQKDVEKLFTELIKEIDRAENDIDKVKKTLDSINDNNDRIGYLRAVCINSLTMESADIFMKNADNIIAGKYNNGLVDEIEKNSETLRNIKLITDEEIYNHDSVVQLEITGYKVMNDLLSLFIPAILKKEPNHKDKKIRYLLPNQFKTNSNDNYQKVLSVLDYVSGMTDLYAIELYRKLFGIDIPKHS